MLGVVIVWLGVVVMLGNRLAVDVMTTEGALGVVMVWLGVVVMLGNRLAVDVMTTEGMLGVVMVWLGVVVVLGNRLAVDVIIREDVIDGLAVVVVVTEGFCIAVSANVVCGDTEGFCIADTAVVDGVVTGVANTALLDDTTFTEVKAIAEESCV
jgi:hypothetical protein